MLWPTEVSTFLSAGGKPNFHVALLLQPVLISTGNPVSAGYWTGHEDVELTLGGVSHTLYGTKGALSADDANYAVGTDVRTTRVRVNGLSDQGRALIHTYDIEFAPAEVWHLCFDQGQAFIGARRMWKGEVDTADMRIGAKGTGSSLTLTIASSARSGTRTVSLKKSSQSYLKRSGDTAMEYASMTEVDSDWWGPRG